MNCTVRTVITQSSEPGCDETAMLGVGVPFGRFMSQHQGAVYRWHQSLVLTKYLPIYKYLRIYKYLQISPCPQVQLRQRLHDGGHLHPLLRRPPLERDQARLSGCVYLDIYPNYLQGVPKKMSFLGKIAITTLKLIQNANVGGVLENSGYLLPDGHWDFQNWGRNAWENEA